MSSFDACRDSDGGRSVWYVFEDDCSGADARSRADANRTEDGRFRSDVDTVFDDRRVVLAASHPDRYLVIDGYVIADPGGRVDDHAASTMRKSQVVTYACPGGYLRSDQQ